MLSRGPRIYPLRLLAGGCLSFLNPDLAAADFIAVQCLHRGFRLTVLGHFDEGEAFGSAGFFIQYQIAKLHRTMGGKQGLQFGFGGVASEIAN